MRREQRVRARRTAGSSVVDELGVLAPRIGLAAPRTPARAVDVGLEVPQVGVRPDLLLAGDLAGRDLVEQLLGAVGDLVDGERERPARRPCRRAAGCWRRRSSAYGRSLRSASAARTRPAVGLGRRRPQVLLDPVPAGPLRRPARGRPRGRRSAGRGRRTTRRRARSAPSGRGSAGTARGPRRRRRPRTRRRTRWVPAMQRRRPGPRRRRRTAASASASCCVEAPEGDADAAGVGDGERGPDAVADHARLAGGDVGARARPARRGRG